MGTGFADSQHCFLVANGPAVLLEVSPLPLLGSVRMGRASSQFRSSVSLLPIAAGTSVLFKVSHHQVLMQSEDGRELPFLGGKLPLCLLHSRPQYEGLQ